MDPEILDDAFASCSTISSEAVIEHSLWTEQGSLANKHQLYKPHRHTDGSDLAPFLLSWKPPGTSQWESMCKIQNNQILKAVEKKKKPQVWK